MKRQDEYHVPEVGLWRPDSFTAKYLEIHTLVAYGISTRNAEFVYKANDELHELQNKKSVHTTEMDEYFINQTKRLISGALDFV